MTLCHLCSALTLETLYPPNFFRHARDFGVLAEAAKACRLCKMIHWSVQYHGNEAEHHPTLDFEGAADVITPYQELEERNRCSVKLQIVPGDWNQVQPSRGFSHIGIWLKSRWMISDLTISVEEGA